jgi:hypothetical protein
MRSSPFVFPSKDGIIDEAPTQREPRNGTRAFTPIDGYSRIFVDMIAINSDPDPGLKPVFGKSFSSKKVRL